MRPSESALLGGISVFAGVLLYNSLDMPFSSGMTFGPGFVPLIVAIALLGIMVARVMMALVADSPPDAHDRDRQTTSSGSAVLAIVAFIGFMALMVFAMSYVGVLLPLGLAMAMISWFFAGHSLARSIIVTLVVLLAIYTVFAIWLKVPLY